MTHRNVIPHFSRAEARLVDKLLSTYADSQDENAAVGRIGKREANLARRARKALRVAVNLATPPRFSSFVDIVNDRGNEDERGR